MQNRLVIDTSVYITYAMFNKIYRLFYAIDKYDLEVFVNENLLIELENNLHQSLRFKNADPSIILAAIRAITNIVTTEPIFNNSPDSKDNFLFDIAIQTNSEVIVTSEKALLDFKESPIVIHDIKWFKETYPVPL